MSFFTIPSELYPLVYANQKSLYQLMFKFAADTLLSLSKDKKYLGATPGIMMVLHTAGSAMNYHPHIHACISGGGLTKANQFVEGKHKGYLFPVESMNERFRTKFLTSLKELWNQNSLDLDNDGCRRLRNSYEWKEFIDHLFGIDWCPFIKETFNGFGNAVAYLARYTCKTAISNSRIDKVDADSVTFHYKNYKEGGKTATKVVSGDEFLRLFLMHVLPKGFCRVRFYGYLSNCCKQRSLL